MNKKLIALAVASTVALPTVSMAEVELYGRINNALDFVDSESGGSSNVSNISSRLGVKANVDLGNGLTAHGRYEFSTFTDIEGETDEESGNGGINDTRIGTVGLSGSFGRVDIGNQWSGFYNKVGTHMEPTYTLGWYLYSGFANGPYRQSNAVKYSNSFGPVSIELDGRLSEDESGDREKLGADNGYGISVGIDPSENFYVGIAYDEQQDGADADAERLGAALKANFGMFSAALSRMEYEKGTEEIDTNSLYLYLKPGSTTLSLGYIASENDDVEPSQVVLGAYHNLGGGFKLYAEATDVDYDGAGDDFKRYLAGMRFDF